jgi:GxxExxY protein
MKEFLHRELSYRVVGALFKVHNYLGPGLLESAYESALVIELRRLGLFVDQQQVFPLFYEGECAGAYIADLVVEKKIIIELKSVKHLNGTMEAQLLNYLRLSGIRVGYLVNFFTHRLNFKRMVL